MEFFFNSIATIFMLFSFLLFIVSGLLLRIFSTGRCFGDRHTGATTGRLPPGPGTLPVIGNLHLVAGTLLHRTFRTLSLTHGPLMHLRLGEVPVIVVSSPEAAREIMKTHDTKFASRPELIAAKVMIYGAKDLLFSPYGEYWRQLRKLCVVELLSARRVESFRASREAEVSAFVRRIASASASSGGAPINLSHMLYMLTMDMITSVAFGDKCADNEAYLSAMREAIKFGAGFSLADLFPSFPVVRALSGIDAKLSRCHKKVDSILDSIVETRKKERSYTTINPHTSTPSGTDDQENLLNAMLRLQEDGGGSGGSFSFITNTTIKALLFDIFQAGSGTTASLLTWAMAELLRNPAAMKKAQAEVRGRSLDLAADVHELPYLKLVAKETMRLHPPVPLLVPRQCTEECEIGGYTIPAGARVVVNAWAMGRDARWWGDDAEEFSPERFEGSSVDFRGADFKFVPFGAGRRMCPGILLGVMNIELVLAAMLYHFDWGLPEGLTAEEVDMTEDKGLGARKKQDLLLHATPYRASSSSSFLV